MLFCRCSCCSLFLLARFLFVPDLFNLRYSAKSLTSESKKCEKNAALNKIKCKKAMEQGNMEGARIFAESAIRDKNTSLNCTRHNHTSTAKRAQLFTSERATIAGRPCSTLPTPP